MSKRLALRAYAAHRKEQGLRGGTLSAVQKAILTERIANAVGEDGLIDVELADQLWFANTRVSMQPLVESPAAFAPADAAAALERAVAACAADGCSACQDAVNRDKPELVLS